MYKSLTTKKNILFLLTVLSVFIFLPASVFAKGQKIQSIPESMGSVINLNGIKPAAQLIQERGTVRIQEGGRISSAIQKIQKQGIPVKSVVVIDPNGNIYRQTKEKEFTKMPQSYPQKPDGGKTLREVLKAARTDAGTGLAKPKTGSTTVKAAAASHAAAKQTSHSKKGH